MDNKVTVTRIEMQQIIRDILAIVEKLNGIIERQTTRPVERDEKGWPVLGWESHDDPEQS